MRFHLLAVPIAAALASCAPVAAPVAAPQVERPVMAWPALLTRPRNPAC